MALTTKTLASKAEEKKAPAPKNLLLGAVEEQHLDNGKVVRKHKLSSDVDKRAEKEKLRAEGKSRMVRVAERGPEKGPKVYHWVEVFD